VEIARNDLVGARKEFERITEIPLVIYQDQAVFKLAELNYFEAHFDTSLSLLKRFNTKLNTDLTNDALQLQYFIQENKTSSLPALVEFAKADLQMRQRNYPESLSRFLDIVRQYPNALLIDDAMMKIGELHLKLKQTNEAITAFHFITDSIQLSILKDRAQFRIAEISENVLHNKSQAITAYECRTGKEKNTAAEGRWCIKHKRLGMFWIYYIEKCYLEIHEYTSQICYTFIIHYITSTHELCVMWINIKDNRKTRSL
jgi:tetratricopeptide (TPR) repeat protein